MAFLIYKKVNGKLEATGDEFSLAGYNLIYESWISQGKPMDRGWHVSANDLIKTQTQGGESDDTRSLIIDYHPKPKDYIGLLELLDLYIYTYPNGKPDEADWSVVMLRLWDVKYEPLDSEISEKEKMKKIDKLEPDKNGEEILEFLYLHGTDKRWLWGMNGRTNAGFIKGDAREYFKQFF